MKYFKLIILIIIIVAISLYAFLHKDITKIKGSEAYYTGSESCASCHTKKHQSWQHSMHPKIFKKYTDDSQVVADFDNKPAFVEFDKKDIDVIIGGKWEQVFAREIDGEYYPFPAKWMVLTQNWIPYKTKKWQETPLRKKCDGCHTVGLDVVTGEFKEYGVGCESCHGPASQHIDNKKRLNNIECIICHNSIEEHQQLDKQVDIVRSIKSAVCGQCHSRGVDNQVITHQTEVQFNFPVEYLPGKQLSNSFKPTTPATDKKGNNWWGNGVSKNRHQEYADFAKSGHARSLKNLRIKRTESCGGEPEDKCLKCHSGDYIQAKKYQDKIRGKKENKKEVVLPNIDNAQDGITCVVCHNPHKVGNNPDKAADQCINCHTSNTKTFKNYQQTDQSHTPCPAEKVTCADCHMPKIVKTGGQFSLRSHAFKIIPPEATIKYAMPNSCQNGGCHDDKSTQWAIDEYEKFYGDKNEY
ncbi:MAG: cytochrome C [Proteobacteria bacterium]|nr:cytochrome C [Pseudomonadota bacterium]